MNYYQYQTVLGLLTICEENDAVIAINVGHYSENKGEKRESELPQWSPAPSNGSRTVRQAPPWCRCRPKNPSPGSP